MSLAYQIIDAVENDNLTFLKRLLETQGSHLINAKDHDGFTALIKAAEVGHTNIVKFLITHYADEIDVNAVNIHGLTALIKASEKGYFDIVKILIDNYGAELNVNSRNNDGYSALMKASEKGYYDIVKYLIKHYGTELNGNIVNNFGCTALQKAAEKGRVEIVRCLIDHFGTTLNVNVAESVGGLTALMHSAAKGRIEIVKYLFEEFGDLLDVNAQDVGGQTALMKAAEKGRADVVRFMIDHGTSLDVNITDNLGRTASSVAASSAIRDIISCAPRFHATAPKMKAANDMVSPKRVVETKPSPKSAHINPLSANALFADEEESETEILAEFFKNKCGLRKVAAERIALACVEKLDVIDVEALAICFQKNAKVAAETIGLDEFKFEIVREALKQAAPVNCNDLAESKLINKILIVLKEKRMKGMTELEIKELIKKIELSTTKI